MLNWFELSKLVFFVNTSVTYSNASNSHISQYQGPTILLVCGAHPNKLIVTWLCPDQAINGKSQKRIENKLRPFNWFSDPSCKNVLFQLAWLSWVFHASLVSRFVFWCGNPGCAPMQLYTCTCNTCIISSFVNNWQFRRIPSRRPGVLWRIQSRGPGVLWCFAPPDKAPRPPN